MSICFHLTFIQIISTVHVKIYLIPLGSHYFVTLNFKFRDGTSNTEIVIAMQSINN